MTVQIGKFSLEDQVYREIKARGNSIVPCAGCGQYLLEVRDVRSGDNYCIGCSGKKTRLGRYKNSHYSPTQNERLNIFNSLNRAGR